MKNRIISTAMAFAILFFFTSVGVFAQNKPEKEKTKTTEQVTKTNHQTNVIHKEKQEMTHTTQTNIKKPENMVVTKQETEKATKNQDKKNKESVNTMHHKKPVNTTNQKQLQDQSPAKGGNK